MNSNIFVPKYSLKLKATFFVGLLFSLSSIYIFIKMPDFDFKTEGFLWAFFPAMTALAPMVMYRRIEFGNTITFVRWIYPNKHILYRDIIDIGNTGIVTKNGFIPMIDIVNFDELIQKLNEMLESGKIEGEQIPGYMIRYGALAGEAIAISIPIYISLHFTLIYFGFTPNIDRKMFGCALLIGIFLITYSIMLKKSSNKD